MALTQQTLEHVKTLQRALEAEFEQEREEALNQIQHAPMQVLITQGKCWFPVMVKGTEYNKAAYLNIELEKNTTQVGTGLFAIGRKVRIFTKNDETLFIEGSISHANDHGITVATFLDDEPDWLRDGKIGVFLLHDDFTFKEAFKTLSKLISSPTKENTKLLEVFYGETQPEPIKIHHKHNPIPQLNALQNNAVEQMANVANVYLLHGPPGTGKSTTLAYGIQNLLLFEKQILFCAHSNTAVDVMTEKLMQLNINVLRIGNPVKISPQTIAASLDYKCLHNNNHKLVKELKRKARELHIMAGKYKRVFGQEEREHRKLLYTEAKKMSREALEMEEQLEKYLIEDAQVICCTPAMSNTGYLRDLHFSTLVFDEATQGTDPVFWIAGTKAQRIIMAGDHLQLGPTIKTETAKKSGLGLTLFEKGILKNLNGSMLAEQYRMHNEIMQFSNVQFYNNKLIAHIKNASHTLQLNEPWDKPFLFIDTAGSGFEEKQDQDLSTKNIGEAEFCFNYVQAMLRENPKSFSIGIITPYSAQVKLLTELFKLTENVTVNTVDGFQGQEKDMILVSCVRSNSDGEIGFLKDTRRMNVALTRARKKLVVVGDSATLGGFNFYNELISYAENIQAYTTVWEYDFYQHT